VPPYGITHGYVEDYIHRMLPARDALLAELEETAGKEGIAIVGPLVGRLLYILARLSKAKNILELGTAIGYSTIWLARAVERERGRVLTIEIDDERARAAWRNIQRAGLQEVVEVRVGDAIKVVPELKERFDIIFLDADQAQYPFLLEPLVSRLWTGGLVITDNALWGGTVARGESSSNTTAMRRFNEMSMRHPSLETIIVPIRDGLLISLKK